MSYSIHYSPENNKKFPVRQKAYAVKQKAMITVAAVIFALFLLCFDGVRQSIKNFLLPGDPQITEAGIIGFVDDVRSGTGVADAFTTFCEYIIQNG